MLEARDMRQSVTPRILTVTTAPNPPGYSEGTWEYILRLTGEEVPEAMWCDGGYHAEALAREAGYAHARLITALYPGVDITIQGQARIDRSRR
jgi:hypothetical protein